MSIPSTFRTRCAGLLCALLVTGLPAGAAASPTMVRLGYARCDACHLAPQGAGLLSDYGKGIDEAQSLGREEYRPAVEPRAFRYDLRLLTTVASTSATATGAGPTLPSWLRGYVRSSMAAGSHNRLFSTVLFEAPQGAVERLWQSKPALDATAAWEFRPSKGLALAVARDRLPRGVELGGTRTILDEGGDGDRFPTQIRAFIASSRFQLTTYAYAPGSPSALSRRAHGTGALGAVQLFNNHVVIGSSVRRATSDIEDRWSVGGYTRFGTGIWGVLSEHEIVHRTRTLDPLAAPQRYAGYTQVFVAPREWLVASIVGEQMDETGPSGRQAYRWRPELQARLSSHITVTASARNELLPANAGTSLMYLVQFAVKTVQ